MPEEIILQFFFHNPSLWTAFWLEMQLKRITYISSKARVSPHDARELHTLRFNFLAEYRFYFWIQVRIIFHRRMAKNSAIDWFHECGSRYAVYAQHLTRKVSQEHLLTHQYPLTSLSLTTSFRAWNSQIREIRALRTRLFPRLPRSLRMWRVS